MFMSKKQKVQYQLHDLDGLEIPSKDDIKNMLRAADEIIFVGGRTMLAKILKGSKDKKLIEKALDDCPSYGYFRKLSIEEITKRIDWMIVNDYLNIDYNGQLPMIVFSEKGWETYKPVYADELLSCIQSVSNETTLELIERLKKTNRQVIELILTKIGDSKNIGYIAFLSKWEIYEVKKVRALIKRAINKLKATS